MSPRRTRSIFSRKVRQYGRSLRHRRIHFLRRALFHMLMLPGLASKKRRKKKQGIKQKAVFTFGGFSLGQHRLFFRRPKIEWAFTRCVKFVGVENRSRRRDIRRMKRSSRVCIYLGSLDKYARLGCVGGWRTRDRYFWYPENCPFVTAARAHCSTSSSSSTSYLFSGLWILIFLFFFSCWILDF